ncbi:PREDICTED: uncharacterized protein LOC18601718 [Theobroma cacao]|uniref:Uncharacterized protein LOC18601718 n=1 Tax=Theobroma cacao TaxID=3641 RepID=A0AB32W9G5_THECC|nr:PREDICTED: uncharacterized protein LOC18601718 [Theobroma cacao]
MMRSDKLKNPGLSFALAVLLILLNTIVSQAALISRDSSSSTKANIAEYIGEEEFLMESGAGVNARLLASNYISYESLQKGQPFPGDKYAIALNKDNRGCQIYDKCRQVSMYVL